MNHIADRVTPGVNEYLAKDFAFNKPAAFTSPVQPVPTTLYTPTITEPHAYARLYTVSSSGTVTLGSYALIFDSRLAAVLTGTTWTITDDFKAEYPLGLPAPPSILLDGFAQSGPVDNPDLDAPAPPVPIESNSDSTDTSVLPTVPVKTVEPLIRMASLMWSGTTSTPHTFINPLGPISDEPLPKTYLEWIRCCYLFVRGSSVVKIVGTTPIMASILPYSGSFPTSTNRSTEPPMDTMRMVGEFFNRSLTSTGSYSIDTQMSPLEIILPFLSDSLALFNTYAGVYTDNNYPTLMLSHPTDNKMSPISVYIAGGDDITFHYPIPPPPLVANIWADMSKSEQNEYLHNTTERSWLEWITGLFTAPTQTVATAFRQIYQYATVAFGAYNNFIIPGTVAKVQGSFYF
jgi:hypothetical protein